MKEYLVDVPVELNIWIRPKLQRMQFEVVKKARPSILFLQSDGGRNEEEWKAIWQNRRIFDEEIDWDCAVYKIYEERNLGLYTMGFKMIEFVWRHVDRCIFLEDDIIPSVSYFRFCAELLEKYKDDYRIHSICGFNLLGKYERPSSDYFFSKKVSIWGHAMWKRTWDKCRNMEYGNDGYVYDLLRRSTRKDYGMWRRIEGYARDAMFDGHVAGVEFFAEFSAYSQHQVFIVPKYSLVSCWGADGNSAHFDTLDTLPRSQRRILCRQPYEVAVPLKHPAYVIPDDYYAKKRDYILGVNHAVLVKIRKLERVWLLIKKGRVRHVLKKLVTRLRKEKNIEM